MNKKKPRRGKVTLIKRVDPQASKSDQIKHGFRELKRSCKDIHWWRRESSRYLLEFYYKSLKGNSGIYVAQENWDNLVVLDACRYDVLKEVMGKNIDYRISRGSTTVEWIKENFAGTKFNDIVYVTANPWVSMVARNLFYKLIPVWKDGWDEDLWTVHPKTTTEYAKEAAERYPDKRLIVHYMQPHAPYIVKNNLPKRPMPDLEKGKLDPLDVWALYKQSLEATLPYVYELMASLTGRTVISSDHGELFGKKLLFVNYTAHPWGIRVPELIKVPWVVFEGDRDARKPERSERLKLVQLIGRLKGKGQI